VKRRIWKIFIMLSLVFFNLNNFIFAEDFSPSLDALFEESCKKTDQVNSDTFVWWFPRQWWQVNLKLYPVVYAQDLPAMLKLLEPYNMIFAVRYQQTGQYGAVTYKDRGAIRKILRLEDAQGNIYKPLDDEQVNLEVRNLLNNLRPKLAEKAVSLGQDMYFFVFPGKNPAGEEYAQAKKPGKFSVYLGDEEFNWKLPLSAFFPPKKCPLCKRQLKSDYQYCPYDGTKLSEEVQQ